MAMRYYEKGWHNCACTQANLGCNNYAWVFWLTIGHTEHLPYVEKSLSIIAAGGDDGVENLSLFRGENGDGLRHCCEVGILVKDELGRSGALQVRVA